MKAFLAREARLLARLEQKTAGRYAVHLTVSELDADRLREIVPGARCHVVPNGVDVDFFAPSGAVEQPNSLVFAGRMNWYPNEHAMCAMLRELWPALKQRIPGLRLTIAGMNPTRSLHAAAAGDPDVRITGFVEEIRPLIAEAALYVCPIMDGGGTRLKLLDAMAMGKAIVATPLAAEGLDVRDGEELVISEFGEEFVAAVTALLADHQRRERLGQAARRKAVETYGWVSIGRDLFREYERVAQGRDRGRR